MKPFNKNDVLAALNEIRPHAQKLVDRFGESQASAILRAVTYAECPEAEVPPVFLFRNATGKWEGL
jgi:hypothetical protein